MLYRYALETPEEEEGVGPNVVEQPRVAHGVSEEEVAEFMADATSGDYYKLLAVCRAWVVVE